MFNSSIGNKEISFDVVGGSLFIYRYARKYYLTITRFNESITKYLYCSVRRLTTQYVFYCLLKILIYSLIDY
jgi:hypothetical protein